MVVYGQTKCVNVELKNIECGWEKCSPEHSFGPAIRQYCLVHYVERGTGIFEINGKRHKVTAGQIFYIPPKIVTYYEADKKDPWFYRWLGVEGRNVEKCLENGGLTADNAVVKADRKTRDVMKKILDRCQDGEGSFEVSSLVYEFLHTIGAKKSVAKTKTNGEIYVEKAKAYIHLYLHRKLKVGEVSKYLNIDRSYLTSLFKKAEGISPQQYIIQKKMKTACEYLLSTDYDVSHIAHSVGYDDLFVFSHAFTKVVGLSPTGYRKNVSQKK